MFDCTLNCLVNIHYSLFSFFYSFGISLIETSFVDDPSNQVIRGRKPLLNCQSNKNKGLYCVFITEFLINIMYFLLNCQFKENRVSMTII